MASPRKDITPSKTSPASEPPPDLDTENEGDQDLEQVEEGEGEDKLKEGEDEIPLTGTLSSGFGGENEEVVGDTEAVDETEDQEQIPFEKSPIPSTDELQRPISRATSEHSGSSRSTSKASPRPQSSLVSSGSRSFVSPDFKRSKSTPPLSAYLEDQNEENEELTGESGLLEQPEQERTPTQKSRSRTPSQVSKYSKSKSPSASSYRTSQREENEDDFLEEREETLLAEELEEFTPSQASRSPTPSQISKYSKSPSPSAVSQKGSERIHSAIIPDSGRETPRSSRISSPEEKSVKQQEEEEEADPTYFSESLTGIIRRCLLKDEDREEELPFSSKKCHSKRRGNTSNLLLDLSDCRELRMDYPSRDFDAERIFRGSSTESPRRRSFINSTDNPNQNDLLKQMEARYSKLEKLVSCLTAERNLMKEKLTQSQKEIEVLTGKRIRTEDDDDIAKGRVECLEKSFLECQEKIMESQREIQCLHLELRHANDINLQMELEKESQKRENLELTHQLAIERRQQKELKTSLKYAEKQLELNGIQLQRMRAKLACIIHWLHPDPRPSLEVLNKESTKVLQCMMEKLIANIDDELSCLRANLDDLNMENKHLRRALCLAEDTAKANCEKAEKLEEKLLSIQDSMQNSVTDLTALCRLNSNPFTASHVQLEHLLNRVSSQENCTKRSEDRVRQLEKRLCRLQNERKCCLNGIQSSRETSQEKIRKTKEKYKLKIKCLVERLKAAYEQSELLRTLLQSNSNREKLIQDGGTCSFYERAVVPPCPENNGGKTYGCLNNDMELALKERLKQLDKKLCELNYASICSHLSDTEKSPTSKPQNCFQREKDLNCQTVKECPKQKFNLGNSPSHPLLSDSSSLDRTSDEVSESSDAMSSEKNDSCGYEKKTKRDCSQYPNTDQVKQHINRAKKWATSVIGRNTPTSPVVHYLPSCHVYDNSLPTNYNCATTSSLPCCESRLTSPDRKPVPTSNSSSYSPITFTGCYEASSTHQEPTSAPTSSGRCRQSRSQCDYSSLYTKHVEK